MLENIMMCGYTAATPIQRYLLPAVLQGRDVVAVAQTGSGKTGAYLIPVLSKLMGKFLKIAAPRPGIGGCTLESVRAEPLVLILAPTRELATQIFDHTRRLAYRTMLRPCVVYGGGPFKEQLEELRKGCDILIATAGRLKDFLSKPHILSLNRVKSVHLLPSFLKALSTRLTYIGTPSSTRLTSSLTPTGKRISSRLWKPALAIVMMIMST
jgi:ATP-dependent RNA helicase DDX3X